MRAIRPEECSKIAIAAAALTRLSGVVTRSGLQIIHDGAGSRFFAIQGDTAMVDRVSMSDEQRPGEKNGPGPHGLCPRTIVDGNSTVPE